MSPNALDDFLGPLKAKYIVQLRERRVEITDFIEVCVQADLGEEIQQDMRKKIHRLAGSAATYGFPWISNAARTLETAIDAQMDAPKILELTQALLLECDRAIGSSSVDKAQ